MTENLSVQQHLHQHPYLLQPLSQHQQQFLDIQMDSYSSKSSSFDEDHDMNDDDDDDENTSTDASEELQSSICKKCNLPINEGHAYELGGVQSNFLVLGTGALVCSSCSYSCKNCGKKIDDLAILTGDQAYCSSCFCCRSCKKKIEDLRYARTSKGLFCMPCHERLLEKKRKQDQQRKLQQLQLHIEQRPHVARAKSNDRRSIITNEMLDKNLPEIPLDSVSSSSSNIDGLMTPQLTKDSTKNASSSKEDHLDVILDIPIRSPQRNPTLAPPADLEMSKIDHEDDSNKQSNLRSPSLRNAPLSPLHAANRKAVVMDPFKSNKLPNEEDENESYIEMDINIDHNLNPPTLAKGLNIENLQFKQQPQVLQQQDTESKNSSDFMTTPNGKSKNFKFGSGGTPKSPTKEKISQGLTRSMSIKSPKNFFQRHKRSISGSLDLTNSSPKPNSLSTTAEEEPLSTTLAYRTPPVPTDSKFGINGHIRAASDTQNFDMSGLQHQTELELRTLRAEIHNMTTVKSSLRNEIDLLVSEKEKLSNEILEQRKLLDQLKNDKTSVYSSKVQSSSSSSVLNDYFRTTSSSTPQPQPSLPRSSSSNNFIDDTTIVQVEDIVELKPKQKARFWRKPKLTKTKDMISSPSNYSISKDLENNDTFVTNLEDNKMKPKIFQSNAKKIEAKELFGAPLELRCQYEKRNTPYIITRCIEQVELKGLTVEGIYRISGGTLLIEKLENAFKDLNPDSGGQLKNLNELMGQDIHAVSSVLKRYLRKLPNPIIPYEYYPSFIELSSIDSSLQIQQLKTLINKLPDLNCKILIILLNHLLRIFENANVNKMTLKNISVVFGPTLMRDLDPKKEIVDMASRTIVLEFILNNYDEIFR